MHEPGGDPDTGELCRDSLARQRIELPTARPEQRTRSRCWSHRATSSAGRQRMPVDSQRQLEPISSVVKYASRLIAIVTSRHMPMPYCERSARMTSPALELLQLGMTNADVATEVGCHRSTVFRVRKRFEADGALDVEFQNVVPRSNWKKLMVPRPSVPTRRTEWTPTRMPQ